MKKLIVIALAGIVLVSVFLYVLYSYRVTSRNTVEKLVSENKMINILVTGANSYNDDRYSFFALCSINPENYRIGITFIPPSYRVFLDEDRQRQARIDEIEFSSYNKILVQLSLKEDLRLHVPYFIELYPPDVKRMVNLFEGVELFILDQVRDCTCLDFGVNYLDGPKIMHYINSVENDSIYLKYDRILDVIATMYHRRDIYSAFYTMPFVEELFHSVKTNLLPQELFKLAEIAFKDGFLTSIILPGSLEESYYIVDDIAYKIYEAEFLKKLVLNDGEEPVTKIKILNGTNVPGLARKMRNNLIRDGLNVMEFGTSPYPQMKHSIIISRKAEYAAVKKVSDIAGIPRIYHIIDNTLLNNVLIIIGEDLKE